MIIGLSGRMGSGKDTAAVIMMKLLYDLNNEEWHNKKFANKLKLVTAILTGTPLHYLESQEIKAMEMPDCWDYNYDLIDHDNQQIIGRGIVKLEDRRKKYTYREFLQRVGTEAMRNGIHQNVWVNALFADYDEEENKSKWIISDVRFKNEAEAIKQLGGIIIRIDRDLPEVENSNHPSEHDLDNWEFDYTVTNNGTKDELAEKLQEILLQAKIL